MLVFLSVILFFIFNVVHTTKSDLPQDLKDPVLFCEGCYGTMYEIDNMMIELKHLKLTERVRQTINTVCTTELLRKYVFSPPKMTKVSLFQLLFMQNCST